MIASCTHLRLVAWWALPLFLFSNIFALWQLKRSSGLLGFKSQVKNGKDFYTLTMWQDEKSMLAYVNNGPHYQAMKRFPLVADIFKSKVVRWKVTEFPSWQDALERNANSNYEYLKSPAAKLAKC